MERRATERRDVAMGRQSSAVGLYVITINSEKAKNSQASGDNLNDLEELIDKFVDQVFSDKKKLSKREYYYRACATFRIDKSLSKTLLRVMEERGYIEKANRGQKIKVKHRE